MLYTRPAAMEPLLPQGSKEQMAQLSCAILQRSGALSARIPSTQVRLRAAALVSEMNSYYSNLIEGHRTLPRDIERALKSEFSSNDQQRDNQYLSKAHVEVERLMLDRLRHEPDLSIHSLEFLSWLHREFFQRLPEHMQWGESKSGKKHRIVPGAIRNYEVNVGSHQPPAQESLPRFMARFERAYSSKDILRTEQVVALSAALSAVGQSVPPRVERNASKCTAWRAAVRLHVNRKNRSMCSHYGQHTHGARTTNNRTFSRAGLVDPTHCARAEDPSQDGPAVSS